MSNDPAALARFFADVVRCETRLYNALNDRLRERHGIVTSQFEFLHYLREHPGARVADLAAEFAVGIGATSKSADRLERAGLIERQPNPDDRRSSLLVLTDEGARLVDAAVPTVGEALAELVAGPLGPAAIADAARAFAVLRSALEDGRIGAPAG
ncbi:MarR family winged helix-turn-helix transcriptional regulator [Actinospica robiniae]|uniref:MarR family winged helix-turn-helix transcriptional regulator n=1 Tax=Actinospica robiniae TaxID=304901 RepID=UPI0003F66180|nr:MarR family transcriptional regulator [Actinospica robiniae]